MNRFQYDDTALIHAGIPLDERTGAVNIPVYLTSTFRQDGLGKMRGYEYARTGNPTREALEALIADLDGGTAGFAFASGMAATTAVLSQFRSGDEIIISSNVYGGTFRVLDKIFDHFGFTYQMLPEDTSEAFERLVSDRTAAVFLETPANPLMTITDIRALADAAHTHDVQVIVDNTFMTPYLQKPIELGADIVVYSATKYLGGHSDLVAGLAVVTTGELAEKLAFIQNATGGVLPPFDSFLLIRGLRTLSVRMERHGENAGRVARWLAALPDVKKVYYPGLPDFPGHEIHARQAKNGGGMISFELTEEHNIDTFFESLKLVSLAESLGGVESLVCHPATMTHASIPKEIREKTGITDRLIRLSVGIEAAEDIIADLEQAIIQSVGDR